MGRPSERAMSGASESLARENEARLAALESAQREMTEAVRRLTQALEKADAAEREA